MTEALAGWTVGVTAARRRAELGEALERRGARVVYGPAIRIVALADDTVLRDATMRCIDAPLDLVLATTGVGFRGWLDAAHGWQLGARLHEAFGAATILARGPKARGAVRAAGLREAWSPESESSAEMLAHVLAHYEPRGLRIAVQLHGDPLLELVTALRAAGADVIEVPVYRWVPPADEQPLHELIEQVATRAVDALTFTSAPAATNFLRTAHELGRADAVCAALAHDVLCVAVGPVTAGPLVEAGVPVAQPERYRLGALVHEVARLLTLRAQVVRTAGHRLELRGHAVLLDDEFVALRTASMTVLRALATAPGRTVSRDELAGRSGLAGVDDRVVDSLRAALGDPAIVRTDGAAGYHLAVGG